MKAKDYALHVLRSQPDRPEPWHDARYAKSLEYIDYNTKHRTVLEFGGPSIFTTLASAYWQLNVTNTGDEDVRTIALSPRYDTVLMMEVIEHLHDLPRTDSDRRARWTASGQQAALHNAASALEIGGFLFVTTPNAAGFRVLHEALCGRQPITFKPHVRELCKDQLLSLIKNTGLEVVDHGEWVVWDHHGLAKAEQDRLHRVIKSYHSHGQYRGDCLYALARKV